MKKTLVILAVLLLSLVFVGCDVTYDIQKNDNLIITIECDDDDVDEYGEVFGFDEGDLDNKDDLEDILEDILDDIDDIEGDISVLSFKRKRNDFIMKFEYIPNDDIDDALIDGIAVGVAIDILDEYANLKYDDDFDDIYDKEFSDDIDDEKVYAFDAKGNELDDKEVEHYFDKAKLTKLTAADIKAEDVDITVPGKIELIISPDDSVDIDDGIISADRDIIIIYRTGSSALAVLLIIALLAGLGVGGYFGYQYLQGKKGDMDADLEDENIV